MTDSAYHQKVWKGILFLFLINAYCRMEKFKHYNLQKAGEKAKLPQIPPFPLGNHSYRLLLVNLHNVHDFNNCYNFGSMLLMLFIILKISHTCQGQKQALLKYFLPFHFKEGKTQLSFGECSGTHFIQISFQRRCVSLLWPFRGWPSVLWDSCCVFATVLRNGVKAGTCPVALMKSDMGPEYLCLSVEQEQALGGSVAPSLHAAALVGSLARHMSVVGEKQKLGLEHDCPSS